MLASAPVDVVFNNNSFKPLIPPISRQIQNPHNYVSADVKSEIKSNLNSSVTLDQIFNINLLPIFNLFLNFIILFVLLSRK